MAMRNGSLNGSKCSRQLQQTMGSHVRPGRPVASSNIRQSESQRTGDGKRRIECVVMPTTSQLRQTTIIEARLPCSPFPSRPSRHKSRMSSPGTDAANTSFRSSELRGRRRNARAAAPASASETHISRLSSTKTAASSATASEALSGAGLSPSRTGGPSRGLLVPASEARSRLEVSRSACS